MKTLNLKLSFQSFFDVPCWRIFCQWPCCHWEKNNSNINKDLYNQSLLVLFVYSTWELINIQTEWCFALGQSLQVQRRFQKDVGLLGGWRWEGNTEVKSNVKSTKVVCLAVQIIPKYRRPIGCSYTCWWNIMASQVRTKEWHRRMS